MKDVKRFNEAAGIHRRKPDVLAATVLLPLQGFNEAAGIHRRKPSRETLISSLFLIASMRPPEFTGGNS